MKNVVKAFWASCRKIVIHAQKKNKNDCGRDEIGRGRRLVFCYAQKKQKFWA